MTSCEDFEVIIIKEDELKLLLASGGYESILCALNNKNNDENSLSKTLARMVIDKKLKLSDESEVVPGDHLEKYVKILGEARTVFQVFISGNPLPFEYYVGKEYSLLCEPSASQPEIIKMRFMRLDELSDYITEQGLILDRFGNCVPDECNSYGITLLKIDCYIDYVYKKKVEVIINSGGSINIAETDNGILVLQVPYSTESLKNIISNL